MAFNVITFGLRRPAQSMLALGYGPGRTSISPSVLTRQRRRHVGNAIGGDTRPDGPCSVESRPSAVTPPPIVCDAADADNTGPHRNAAG